MREFAVKHELHLGTLYDFLNAKANVNSVTLEKILIGAGMSIGESTPFKVFSSNNIMVNGKRICEGDSVRVVNKILLTDGGFTHVVHSCFSSSESIYQGLILQDLVSSEMQLIIYSER